MKTEISTSWSLFYKQRNKCSGSGLVFKKTKQNIRLNQTGRFYDETPSWDESEVFRANHKLMFRQTCCQEEKKNILKKTQGLVLDWFTILWLKDKQTFSVSVASFSLNSRLVFNLIFKTHKSLQLWRNRWRRGGGGAASSAQVTWGGGGDDDSKLFLKICTSF